MIIPSELNERHRRFWEIQNPLRDRRIADEAIREVAFARLRSELARRIPAYYQGTIEQFLADAERDRDWFLSQLGRKGGRAKKSDPLQQAILYLVRRDPYITERKLKDILSSAPSPDPS